MTLNYWLTNNVISSLTLIIMFLGKRDRLFDKLCGWIIFEKIFANMQMLSIWPLHFNIKYSVAYKIQIFFLAIICLVQNPAPMRRCGRVQFIWYPGSNCNVWGCDVYRNGLHTVVPERLQSSFGLLRMSHLLPQISFAPLMYSHPLCILVSFTFSPAFLQHCARLGSVLARLIMRGLSGRKG